METGQIVARVGPGARRKLAAILRQLNAGDRAGSFIEADAVAAALSYAHPWLAARAYLQRFGAIKPTLTTRLDDLSSAAATLADRAKRLRTMRRAELHAEDLARIERTLADAACRALLLSQAAAPKLDARATG